MEKVSSCISLKLMALGLIIPERLLLSFARASPAHVGHTFLESQVHLAFSVRVSKCLSPQARADANHVRVAWLFHAKASKQQASWHLSRIAQCATPWSGR